MRSIISSEVPHHPRELERPHASGKRVTGECVPQDVRNGGEDRALERLTATPSSRTGVVVRSAQVAALAHGEPCRLDGRVPFTGPPVAKVQVAAANSREHER